MTTTPTLQREAATAAQAASSSLPFYAEQGDECALFAQCHAQQLPLLIKGPTGCGKTRFVEHMAARLGRPLITVSCHDDLSAADLVGRHLIGNGSTVWADGPLTRAVREGAIVYLDEVVEARKDTTVVLHANGICNAAPATTWLAATAACHRPHQATRSRRWPRRTARIGHGRPP